MTNGNGRKAQIRQYATDNDLVYTAALRKFQRADALFPRFVAEWVKVSDYPIRLDGLDLRVSITPDLHTMFRIDLDRMELLDEFRTMAEHIALGEVNSWLGARGLNHHDWTSNAAPYATPVTDDERHSQADRVALRVVLAYRRLFGAEILVADQQDGNTIVWLDVDMSFGIEGIDWDDIEKRGAYDEAAELIEEAADDEDDPGTDYIAIDYSDPDWASKVTVERFVNDGRRIKAEGGLAPGNEALLDRDFPGWYDEWLDAEPMSHQAFHRRNAITRGVVPEGIRVLNHGNDPAMEFENLSTGQRVDVELTGSDEEMRGTVRAAVEKLGL
jgi:hypothetical protein